MRGAAGNSRPYRDNAKAVRIVLQESERVLAVFQGHSHQNDLKEILGIHYCTFVAMVEGAGLDNNGYSVVKLYANGSIEIDGFCKQKDYRWPKPNDKADPLIGE